MKKWILRAGLALWLVCSVFSLTLSLENRRLPGPRGIQGIQGNTGLWGLRGPQGEQGERGYSVNLPKLYKQTSPAVVWIGAEYSDNDFLAADWREIKDLMDRDIPITVKWQGTGFFVTPNLIATAGHIVENTKSFIVQFQDDSRTYADFVHMENMDRCDVGFIKLRGSRCNDFYLDLDTEIDIGENLVILGYPWGLNNGVALTQGVMSLSNRSEPYFGVKLVMQTDVASWPGNSGSPVIDMDGECVGILIGGMRGCDNFSIVTPARLVELAMQKALAEIGLRDAK